MVRLVFMKFFKGNHKKKTSSFVPGLMMKERLQNLQNGENLACFQLHIVELGNEHCGHTLEDGCAVHVHRGPDGEDEPADPLVYTIVFFNALNHRGKGCRAGNANNQP